MSKMKPGDILPLIKQIETVIANGEHSNRMTAYYFAVLSYYYYCGGKADLKNKLEKSGILNSFKDDRTKLNYYNNAQAYILGGLTVINIMKYRKTHDIFPIRKNEVQKILQGIQPALEQYNIKVNRKKLEDSIDIEGPSKHIKEKIPDFEYIWELEDWISNKVVVAYSNKHSSLEEYYYGQVRYVIGGAH